MITRRPGGLVEEELTRSVIGAFFKVFRTLGFGFLEGVYAAALDIELRARGQRATNLEVGLLLHFGREANFYRLICENRTKPGS